MRGPFFTPSAGKNVGFSILNVDCSDLADASLAWGIGDPNRIVKTALVKGELLAVGQPLRAAREGSSMSDLADIRAVGAHHVDLGSLDELKGGRPARKRGIPIRGERDPCSVGRPRGPETAPRLSR